jgi:hypothetical protein
MAGAHHTRCNGDAGTAHRERAVLAAVAGAAANDPHSARVVEHDEAPIIDQPAAERAVHDLLVALGRDPGAPGLRDTPRPVASPTPSC